MGPEERKFFEAYKEAKARINAAATERRARRTPPPPAPLPPSPKQRRILPELPVNPADVPPLKASDIEMIRKIVATFFGLKPSDVLWAHRSGSMVPRQVAMYLAHELTGATVVQIGEAFNRDHSTIVYSLKKLDALLAQDNEVAATVALARARVMRFFFDGGTP